jgi:alkyl sulfatase BDS1-like metallo-beta-lactamase superfamily hydrolase
MMINFEFPDLGKLYLLQIKNGVLHYFPNKSSVQANFSISVNRSDLNAVILGSAKWEELINAKKVSLHGKYEDLRKFQSLFDSFNPWFNIVEPNL